MVRHWGVAVGVATDRGRKRTVAAHAARHGRVRVTVAVTVAATVVVVNGGTATEAAAA